RPHMDRPVPLIICALLAGVTVLIPQVSPRVRAAAMLATLALAVAILISEIYDASQFHVLRSHPGLTAVGVVIGCAALAVAAWLIDRRPELLALGAAGAPPFRIPISA